MEKKNPFLLRFCAPAYLASATVAITNDFLMALIFILFTLGILGAYVTESKIFPTLYQNKILHIEKIIEEGKSSILFSKKS